MKNDKQNVARLSQELKERMKVRPMIRSNNTIELGGRSKCDPDCEICQGEGVSSIQVEETDFLGRPVLVDRWGTCPNLARRVKISGSGLLPNEISDLGWEKILDDGNAFLVLEEIRKVIEAGFGWVFLWGDPGNAKTVLLKTAVAEYIKSGKPAIYSTMAQVIENLRMAFDTDRPSAESYRRLEVWKNAKLLVLDEVDRVNATAYVKERQFLLLDGRYQAALNQETITIMTSNQDPKTFDPYFASRIHDGRFKVLKMEAGDLRPGMLF